MFENAYENRLWLNGVVILEIIYICKDNFGIKITNNSLVSTTHKF